MNHFILAYSIDGRQFKVSAGDVLLLGKTEKFPCVITFKNGTQMFCKSTVSEVEARLNKYYDDLYSYTIKLRNGDDDNLINPLKG